jgi:hypothetical protein
VVSKTLVPATAHLSIPDAPQGSFLEVDGKKIDADPTSAAGVEVPAGQLDMVVQGPAGQKWVGSASLEAGATSKQSLYTMTWTIPQRTISMSGNAHDWDGLLPLWIPPPQTAFSEQHGTKITNGFACYDDKFLYFKYEFDDGSPTPELAREVRGELDYIQILSTARGDITAITRFRKDLFGKLSTATTLGVRDPISGSWRGLGDNTVKYRIGESSLEVAVPMSSVRTLITPASGSGGFIEGSLQIKGANGNGQFINSGRQMVSFDF